jgi:HK97 gp10 family phage protein
MSDIKITLDTAKLDQIAASLKKNRNDILAAFGFEVERQAAQLAPKDTSTLANSIHTKIQGGGGTRPQDPANGASMEELPEPEGNTVVIVGSGVEYAVYQELGTERMAAQPFLGPALENQAHKLNSGETWGKLVE